MAVDAGSVYSQIRVDLATLRTDLQSTESLFDAFAKENEALSNKISQTIINKQKTAFTAIGKEIERNTQLVNAGAVTEQQAIEQQIAVRKQLLSVLTQNAATRGKYTDEELAQYKQINTEITSLEGQLSTMGSAGGSAFDLLKNKIASMLGPLAIITAAVQAFKKLLSTEDEYLENASAVAKMEAVLKSTGATAWTTSDHIQNLAGSIQSLTGISEEDVMSMETVLLGFRKIQGVNFDKAVASIVDMSKVMDMSLVSAAQAVGKALDDPIKGMDSLTRQGFRFTEQEKENIAALVNRGELEKAQGVILEELARTFEGAAEAAATMKDKTKVATGELNEQLGRSVSRGLNPFRKMWISIAEAIGASVKAQNDFKEAIDKAKAGTATTSDLLTIESEKLAHLIDLKEKLAKRDKSASEAMQDQIDRQQAVVKGIAEQAIAEKRAAQEKAAADAQEEKNAKSKAEADAWQEELTKKRKDLEDRYLDKLKEINAEVAIGKMTDEGASKARADALDEEIVGLYKLVDTEKLSTGATVDLLSRRIDERNKAADATKKETEAIKGNSEAAQENVDIGKDLNKTAEALAGSWDKDQEKIDKATESYKSYGRTEKQNIEASRAAVLAQIDAYEKSGHKVTELRSLVNDFYDDLKKKTAIEKFSDNFALAADKITSIVSSLVDAYTAGIDKQLDALETWYSTQQELLEYDGQTKKEHLEEELANALAANDEELAADYQKQLAQIALEEDYQKQKAQLQYEADMAEWKSSLLTATVDAAQAIVKIWAEWAGNPVVAGVLTAATGVATAAQISAINAAKPTAPAFATGGIVLGSDYSGDKIVARVNSGEMVLTRDQQAQLFAAIQGGNLGGKATTVEVPLKLNNVELARAVVQVMNNGQVRVKTK